VGLITGGKWKATSESDGYEYALGMQMNLNTA
jgi:hypothetical protein